MTDLTERLAAKLKGIAAPYNNCGCADCLAEWLPVVLPLLLSEPELVAGLAPEVKREVLRQLLGERIDEMIAEDNSPFASKRVWLGDINETDDGDFSAWVKRDDLLNLLAPSPAPMEGRSNGNK